jgi:penicillin amidase
MKLFKAILSLFLLVIIVFLGSRPSGKLPPLGNFISPFTGFWQNAENNHAFKNENIQLKGLYDKVDIIFDEHLIPHIYAQNEHDLYLAQGYITAKFRLWQMEIQTMSAAGRISELVGAKTIDIDKYARRTGMVYGAKKSVALMKKNPALKELLDAYTNGINQYIDNLNNATLPFEYKLLNYRPEKWTPLQTGLLLKKMAENLTAMEHDIEHSNALELFGEDAFNLVYQPYWDEQDPIIPKGTVYTKSTPNDSTSSLTSIYNQQVNLKNYTEKSANEWNEVEADYLLGSNNWAISGSKTKSGRPMLCNDPHLKLSLPSIWFQIHLCCPAYNVCGASLPGAPGVISGFNDHIAWGVTNAGRDVRDWYQITFRDSTENEYLLDNKWVPVEKVIEKIVVKGGKTIYDTVRYAHQGPVVYDKNFNQFNKTNLALRWTAHDESEEMLTFNQLNKAKNLADYFEAITHYACPAQNFVFASKQGDIAIQQQGKFPIEKKNQPIFIQDGSASKNDVTTFIPFKDNPHIVNPARGFVSSANQHPTDTTYPYAYAGLFEYFRNRRINDFLANLQQAEISDMKRLQQDNFNLMAKEILPKMLAMISSIQKNDQENQIYRALANWNYTNNAELLAPVYFEIWKDTFKKILWDEFYNHKIPLQVPEDITLVHFINDPIISTFYDIQGTEKKEDLSDLFLLSFSNACEKINELKVTNWSNYKATTIDYLLPNMPAFSRMNVYCGGNKGIVNATSKVNGPSWRMIVEMTDDIHAEAIYPAGQSGNPGSRYYDDMITDWAAGKYYEVWHSAVISDMKKHAQLIIQLHP